MKLVSGKEYDWLTLSRSHVRVTKARYFCIEFRMICSKMNKMKMVRLCFMLMGMSRKIMLFLHLNLLCIYM